MLFVPTIFALLLSFVVLGAAFLFIYLYFLFCCFVCSIFTFYAMPQIFFNSGSFAISGLRNNNAWCFAPVCFCNAFQSFIIVIHVTIKTAGPAGYLNLISISNSVCLFFLFFHYHHHFFSFSFFFSFNTLHERKKWFCFHLLSHFTTMVDPIRIASDLCEHFFSLNIWC